MSEHPFELIARLNARIHNQREALSHKDFLLNRMRGENAETLTAVDKLLFLALTLPEEGQRIAAAEAAQGITTAALGASGMEARRAASEAAVHDSPTAASGDAQTTPRTPPDYGGNDERAD